MKYTFDQLPEAISQLHHKLENIERFLISQRKQPTPAIDELLTVQQAATFLNLAVPTIYSMVQRKELPVFKRAGRLYFSKTELVDYVKAGRKKTTTEIESEAAAYLGSKKKGANHA